MNEKIDNYEQYLIEETLNILEIFTKSHPIGIICYLMVLSLAALGARKYCKITFPILVILYDISSYLIGIENIQQLILINTLALFLSYQMHINERYMKKYFYAFKNTPIGVHFSSQTIRVITHPC